MDTKTGSRYGINGQNGWQDKASDSSRHGQQEGQHVMTSMGRVAGRKGKPVRLEGHLWAASNLDGPSCCSRLILSCSTLPAVGPPPSHPSCDPLSTPCREPEGASALSHCAIMQDLDCDLHSVPGPCRMHKEAKKQCLWGSAKTTSKIHQRCS